MRLRIRLLSPGFTGLKPFECELVLGDLLSITHGVPSGEEILTYDRTDLLDGMSAPDTCRGKGISAHLSA